MRILQLIHAGDLLEIRRQRWRVVDICVYERCQLVTVAGVGPGNADIERRFLVPFDAIAPLDRTRVPRLVGPRRWRHACRGLLAGCTPAGGLRAARLARIDLLPHQLEPALAVVRGRGSRVLLADDVGLGKTIQAGLVIAELQARGQADRVLIATPAGLREQWRAELSDRFGIAAVLVDVREMRRRSSSGGIGLNPWLTTPIAVTSIDYVKRPEVLHAVRGCRWDVVVVDEAHGAGRDTDRHAALSALAARAAYVLLLTATPHSGDPMAFASLCGIGALDDPLLVFRRTRGDVQLGAGRRVHRLYVRPSAAEARTHALLADFTAAVRSEHDSADACLALSVLHKRAFSSARSLERTVSRRLDALGPAAVAGFRQIALPLADRSGELDAADDPPDCLADLGLADEGRERRLLRGLRDAARQAASRETKVSAIRRLLTRVSEPVVIFTEFRDTLLHLRAALVATPGLPVGVLHGGLTRDERRVALDDFASGRRRILLATDAAGEGLNLHHRCRLVVNLELPWNPMRLEQRIGRVDRIGQVRTVHAFHLIARGTGEARVLERLRARIARAQEDIGAANPIDDARAVARFVIDPHVSDATGPDTNVTDEAPRPETSLLRIALCGEARVEAARLVTARDLSDDRGRGAGTAPDATGPWITRARLRTSRVRLGQRAIAILRIDTGDGGGRLIDWTLVPVSFSLAHSECFRPDRMRALLQVAGAALQACADEAGRRDRAGLDDEWHAFVSVRLAREKRIASAVLGAPHVARQPGLFDRRAERADLADRDAVRESVEDIAGRIQILERQGVSAPRPARLLLVLVP